MHSKGITLLLSFYCYMHADTTFEKLYFDRLLDNLRIRQLADWTSRGYRLCGHKVTYPITYACKNINKWLNSNIQLHFIMKHFNMTH